MRGLVEGLIAWALAAKGAGATFLEGWVIELVLIRLFSM